MKNQYTVYAINNNPVKLLHPMQKEFIQWLINHGYINKCKLVITALNENYYFEQDINMLNGLLVTFEKSFMKDRFLDKTIEGMTSIKVKSKKRKYRTLG